MPNNFRQGACIFTCCTSTHTHGTDGPLHTLSLKLVTNTKYTLKQNRELVPSFWQGAQAAGWNFLEDNEPVLVLGYIGDRALWPRKQDSPR